MESTVTDNEAKPQVRSRKKKECPVCCFNVSGLTASPNCCTDPETGEKVIHQSDREKSCNECWEAYISYSVETQHPLRTNCIFCPSPLSEPEIDRLCRKATKLRYDWKLADSQGQRCTYRCAGTLTPSQPYDRFDGRFVKCTLCHAQTCVDCDRPAHPDEEACVDFWDRIAPHHIPAEEAMAENGYKQCPSCFSWGDLSGKPLESCGYLQCGACHFRWCGHCQVPWCGEKSYYTLGTRAHGESCKYNRALPSTYSRKRLYEEEQEAWEGKQKAAKRRREERAEKKRLKEYGEIRVKEERSEGVEMEEATVKADPCDDTTERDKQNEDHHSLTTIGQPAVKTEPED